MLTERNKLSDSISAASGETYTYSMIGERSDVDVAEAFATPAMVAAAKAEVKIKLKKGAERSIGQLQAHLSPQDCAPLLIQVFWRTRN